MKTAPIFVALIMAGCAQPQSVESLRASVGNASNYQLCRAIMLAPENVASIARDESARRSLDCAPYANLVQQGQASDEAARQQAIQQLLNRPAVTPYQIPMPARPVTCNSYRIGNSVQTSCN